MAKEIWQKEKKLFLFCCPNCLKNVKIVAPETGDEIESDDVVSGSTVLFMLCFLLLFSVFRGFSRVWVLLIRFKIENNVRKRRYVVLCGLDWVCLKQRRIKIARRNFGWNGSGWPSSTIRWRATRSYKRWRLNHERQSCPIHPTWVGSTSISYPESSGFLVSGWAPVETLGYWNFVTARFPW